MRKNTIVLLGIVLLKFVLQYVLIHPYYELHRDEYLHLDQGRHLAWGYISVPPLTSWFSFLIRLLGNGEFWIKFFPALFGALTIVLVWKLTEHLKAGLFASVLAALSVLFSGILRVNILYQPNSFDIFFWTLMYFSLIWYIQTQTTGWIYLAGLALGFGLLSKYNILFLAIGLLPALAVTRHRKLFRNRHFYLSLALALLVVLPNLIWQYQNGFPTYYQLRELNDTQLVHVNRFDFLKDQLLLFLSSFFVVIAAFIGLIFYPPFQRYRFLLISYVLTMALFLYFRAKSYYALGLYPVLLSFGAVYLEAICSKGWRYYLRAAAIAFVLVSAIPLLYLGFPVFSPATIASHSGRYQALGLLRWEDGNDHMLPQDFADMTGWRELAQKIDAVYSQLYDKENTLVLCDNYGEAGAINYYSRFPNIRAVSFNADYINWMPLEKPIRNAILVKDVDDSDSTREKEKFLFDSVTYVGQIENPYAREKGTKIYLLKRAKTDINSLLINEIKRRQPSKP